MSERLEAVLVRNGARLVVNASCWEERLLGRIGIRLGTLLMRVRLTLQGRI